MAEIFSSKTHNVAKAIFENVRNTGACATVAIAGGVIFRFPEISLFGPKAAPWVSLALVSLAAVLLIWNIMLGIDTLLQQLPPKSRWVWPVYLVATAIFVVVPLSVLGALVKQQFAAAPTKPAFGAPPTQGSHP